MASSASQDAHCTSTARMRPTSTMPAAQLKAVAVARMPIAEMWGGPGVWSTPRSLATGALWRARPGYIAARRAAAQAVGSGDIAHGWHPVVLRVGWAAASTHRTQQVTRTVGLWRCAIGRVSFVRCDARAPAWRDCGGCGEALAGLPIGEGPSIVLRVPHSGARAIQPSEHLGTIMENMVVKPTRINLSTCIPLVYKQVLPSLRIGDVDVLGLAPVA
jgi:hypothetical protein